MSRLQRVFEVSETKGVLVISPRGDALSYLDAEVVAELDAVLERIRGTPNPRVVVNFGAAQYFGSVIIGAASQLAEEVARLGGVFAVCELSGDMQQVLTAMKLTDRWPYFDTQRAAVKFARRCEV